MVKHTQTIRRQKPYRGLRNVRFWENLARFACCLLFETRLFALLPTKIKRDFSVL